ncbi:hypothetical protein CANINC_003226 [Pichia inconspicua]|uniref:DNA polymerase gamma n=1 Tax=Pichia inconspicua TaxID=52247 RepID=A0A4T0WZA0_9ASCO|nr:hypothetical protein CANINC_003226 [[Candida] inconspicua]
MWAFKRGRLQICHTKNDVQKVQLQKFGSSPYQSQPSSNKSLNKNPAGIQQLSEGLHRQIFPKKLLKGPSAALTKVALKYLQDNELLGKPCSENPPINFKLPKLIGDNINQHFQNLGYLSAKDYQSLVDNLLNIGDTPLRKPDEWLLQSGWTRYAPNEPPQSVKFPLEDELVFDCEVLYKVSSFPVMATCLSADAWYAWCSPYLTGESTRMDHLIPLGTNKRECLIVGHNVSYDRARVLEEYHLDSTKAFFLDTMSLHVAVSGMCSRQRGTWLKYKKKVKENQVEENTLDHLRLIIENEDLRYTMSNMILDQESSEDGDDINSALQDDPWMKNSSMNKLSEVADFYCGIKMEKQLRDHFASEDITEIRDMFQSLMNYCADDVSATYHVFRKVYPKFRAVVPHPVSFAALRHITTSFLPTTSEWNDYIQRCENMYQKSKNQVEEKVHSICKQVVDLRLKKDETPCPWENDQWLSQLDWTIKPVKLTKSGEPYKSQKLPGYPEWYKKLVVKDKLNLTIKTRCASLLLRLSWENKPIFWTESKGWCFVVDQKDSATFLEKKYKILDPVQLLNEISESQPTTKRSTKKKKEKLPKDEDGGDDEKLIKTSRKSKSKKTQKNSTEYEMENFTWVESDPTVRSCLEKLIKENKILFKIPHENGAAARVTSLITKPFLRYYEDGVLSSENKLAKEAFQTNVTNSYWVSSRERIMNQFVVYESSLLKNSKMKSEDKDIGYIIPQIIPMGTITRRAVEKTWLTASNAKKSRLGSELKSLIKAPAGYCFVGADVDSEELWIASLVGDSMFKLHGGTALGWMTLEGTKNAGTDLHSKTAKILGISRNEAKVFNYGRIYGAGVKFATSLLKKFNPSISDEQATEVAKKLYAETKGNTNFIKFSGSDEKVKVWYGGSESVVFNRLESIAEQDDPKTPVLGAGITAALNRTNLNTNSFLPSRINWAIQSSGVDYLHLLLISMEYLSKVYKVDTRLVITVHDEVRYICKEEEKYKVAMMLQIANLWTRSMFCFQLGIENVPQSCAFFSCVDIDKVLRKEVDLDCITPSNPNPIPHGENVDIYDLLKMTEVQEMLDSLDDNCNLTGLMKLNTKIYRPVEELDKQLDSSTKLSWMKLQISKTEKEFKAMKNKFFKSKDIQNLSKFEKKLNQLDNKHDEVVCDGLFDSTLASTELIDAGIVLNQNWDNILGSENKSKRKSKDFKENHDTTYVDMYVDVVADSILEENNSSKSKVHRRRKKKAEPTIVSAVEEPPYGELEVKQQKIRETITPVINSSFKTSETTTREKEMNPIKTNHHSHLTMTEITELGNW